VSATIAAGALISRFPIWIALFEQTVLVTMDTELLDGDRVLGFGERTRSSRSSERRYGGRVSPLLDPGDLRLGLGNRSGRRQFVHCLGQHMRKLLFEILDRQTGLLRQLLQEV
jgi:hypothetical protein